jgi:hypothetical protein
VVLYDGDLVLGGGFIAETSADHAADATGATALGAAEAAGLTLQETRC